MTAECEVCGSPARWTCLVDGGDTINDAGYAEARGERRVMLCDDCRDEANADTEALIEDVVL